MDIKHTPGPWAVFQNDSDEERLDINSLHPSGKGAFFVAETIGGLADGEMEANARLIAAAPDLLQACEQAEHWLDHDDGSAEPAEMLRVLRAAIAKANGGA